MTQENAESGLLAIIEDDAAFARTLIRSFERRGYSTIHARSHDELTDLLRQYQPDFAVVDLKLESSSGLSCVEALRDSDETMKIVVLTGYASIATAVEAIKLGANYYLAKPSNTDDIEAAFSREEGDANIELDGRQSSLKTLEWEHIHQTLIENDFNISQTARRLGMHRRTLARKLEKRQIR